MFALDTGLHHGLALVMVTMNTTVTPMILMTMMTMMIMMTMMTMMTTVTMMKVYNPKVYLASQDALEVMGVTE